MHNGSRDGASDRRDRPDGRRDSFFQKNQHHIAGRPDVDAGVSELTLVTATSNGDNGHARKRFVQSFK